MIYDGKILYQDIKLTEIKPLNDYKLSCRLSNGEMKIYDFTPHLEWEMFKHMKNDEKAFHNVIINNNVVPAWFDSETGEYDLELGLSWIISNGISV